MGQVIKVARKSDIPEGEGIAVTCGNERIALFNVAGDIHAVSDTCPHAGGPLSDGWLEGTEVTCPWHGWSFDVQYRDEDPRDGVCRYKVHIEGDDVTIELPG
jgi:nitrite reductase/ring-hydroxylating ferredoxin subunit